MAYTKLMSSKKVVGLGRRACMLSASPLSYWASTGVYSQGCRLIRAPVMENLANGLVVNPEYTDTVEAGKTSENTTDIR